MKLVLALMVAAVSTARGQAPQASSLWDLPATTLARPPALETGATAMFWNPAAVVVSGGPRIGVQSMQTSDVIGLGGVLVGVGQRLTRRLAVGLVFGRVQIGDLVRTSDSPKSQPGEIPVYEQAGGVVVGASLGRVALAGLIRGHDARFDVFREGGFSADVGLRIRPLPRLAVAAATRFVPIRPGDRTPSRYYLGAEYRALDAPVWGAPATLLVRYGVLVRRDGEWEHTVGAGLEFASRLTIDASVVRESMVGAGDWRAVLSLGIRAGKYDILAARGSGLRGIGANYRVGLEVDFSR